MEEQAKKKSSNRETTEPQADIPAPDTKAAGGSNQRVGRVVQVIGPVVDVEFKEMGLPEIYHAIRITSEGFETDSPIDIIVEVEQHLGEDRVRCVSMHPTDGLARGMKAVDQEAPIQVPVG